MWSAPYAKTTFRGQLEGYKGGGQEITVTVMGAVSHETEHYIGTLGEVYDDAISMTVDNQAVLIRIDVIVSVRANGA